MTESASPRESLLRLADAVDIYLEHRRSDSQEHKQALLAQRPDLRDLLEPMFGETPPEDAATTSRYFGDYELLREIGRGGMGVVYEARDATLHRRVALKLLPAAAHATAARIERFRREAAAAGRLRHPNIAAVHRVGEVDGTHFYSMEFVDGDDLAKVLARVRREIAASAEHRAIATLGLAVDGGWFAEVTTLVARIADALHYAHEHGVVHRDVKPHNIVITADHDVRLVDFGLAKDFDRDGMTWTGDTAGTPDYMSPEQARGGTIDARSDVFSLGAVLYELLTLTRPFAAPTALETLHLLATSDPEPPRRLDARIPRDLEVICQKALEKEPTRRYATAADFAADLRRFARHEPIVAAPPTAVARAVKLVRRNRAAALATMFALIALVVAPLGFALHYKSSRDELAAEQRETVRQRDLATQLLTSAREALDDVHRWFGDERLANVPGGSELRRDVLQRAVEFYARFEELAAHDGPLRIEAARARVLLGGLLFDLRETERAEPQLRAAVAALTELAADGNGELAFDRARAHRYLAGLSADRADFAAAEAELDRAIDALQSAQLADTASSRQASELAATFAQRARTRAEVEGATDAVAADTLSAITLWTELFAADPRRIDIAARAAAASARHARWLIQRGDRAGAQRVLADSAQLVDAVAAQSSTDLTLRQEFVQGLRIRAQCQDLAGDPAAARTTFARACADADALYADFPRLVRCKDLAAGLHYDSAVAAIQADEPSAAIPSLERALALAREVRAERPDSLAAASLLADCAAALALVRPDADSIPLLREGADALRDLCAAHPRHRALHLNLARTLGKLASVLHGARQIDGALDAANEARTVGEQLAAAEPHAEDLRVALESLRRQCAHLLLEVDDPIAAVQLATAIASAEHDVGSQLAAAEILERATEAAKHSAALADRAGEWHTQLVDCLRRAVAIDSSARERIAAHRYLAPFVDSLQTR